MDTNSPTNKLRKRLVADMNEHADLDTHWLLGGAAAFVAVNKLNTSDATVFASMHPSKWLTDLSANDRTALASSLICQLRIEVFTSLGLAAPPCDCRINGQHGRHDASEEVQDV